MSELTAFDWIELIGWLASALTVATYSVNTMIPLRVLAIASSLCFILYALILQLWPLLAMELILLPINCYRFWQIVSLRGRLSRLGSGRDDDFSVAQSYGKARRIASGTTIFQRGDPVDSFYYLVSGRVLVEDYETELTGGEIFGEIAFFTDAATRIATVRCTEDCLVYEVDKKRFMRLQFEDPSFGLSVMRTVTRRLIVNGEVRAAAARALA